MELSEGCYKERMSAQPLILRVLHQFDADLVKIKRQSLTGSLHAQILIVLLNVKQYGAEASC